MIGTRLRNLRMLCTLTLVGLGVSIFASDVFALDRVRDRNGVTTGKISKVSVLGITITKGGTDIKKPVEDIVSITFDDEPDDLSPARRAADSGRYNAALERLAKIDGSDVDRPEVQQEIDFLKAYCTVQLALSGQATLDTAEKEIAGFLSKNSRSYRVPEAIELRGDVLLAKGDYNGARSQYVKLGKAPAPYFKTRSALLTGRSLQAEGNHQAAVEAFNNALKSAAGNAAAQTQTLEVTLLRAVSQAALGEVAAATETIEKIITDANAEDSQLLAQAYNALGDCHLAAEDKKSAKLAFLHVDLLFSSETAEHARALYELSQLWNEFGQADRASDATQRLKDNYPGSRWANR